jgi:hypothetical protein
MPRYVVVDSRDKWLEVGQYDSPEEALAGGFESGDFDPDDKPYNIWVYEYVKEHEFVLDSITGKYTKES